MDLLLSIIYWVFGIIIALYLIWRIIKFLIVRKIRKNLDLDIHQREISEPSQYVFIFCKRKQFPDPQQLQSAIDTLGYQLKLPELVFLTQADNLLQIHARFENLESDFNFTFSAYDSSDWDWEDHEVNRIADYDSVVELSSYNNAQEIVGMTITATALCQFCNGVIYSSFFNDEGLTESSEAVSLLKDIVSNAREQFSGRSKLRIEWENLQAEQAEEMAQEILESIRASYPPKHEYQQMEPNLEQEPNADFYLEASQTLEQLGFEIMADVEDLTLTATMGTIRIRSLFQKKTQTLAAYFYVPSLDQGLCDFESFTEKNIVITTLTPANTQADAPTNIHMFHAEAGTSLEQLYQAHLQHLNKIQQQTGDTQLRSIDNFDQLIVLQNLQTLLKHQHLKQKGWVSREYLYNITSGNQQLADRIYEEIQGILESEKGNAMLGNLFRKNKSQASFQLTPEQDEYLADAIQIYNKSQKEFRKTYGFSNYEEWRFDQDTGKFFLTANRNLSVSADGQIIGSFSANNNTWEWAWNNPHVEPHIKKDSLLVKKYGKKEGLEYLSQGILWLPDEQFGVYLAAVGQKITNSEVVFRGKMGDIFVYLMLKNSESILTDKSL